MNDTIMIEVSVSTNKVGSKSYMEVEFDRDDWDTMTEKEKDEILFECVAENLISWDWVETTHD